MTFFCIAIVLAISGVDAVYVVKWNETAVLGGSVLLSCETPLGSYKVRWKSKKLGVIAVDETVFMKSYRFEIKHHRDTSWSLKISDIELDDDDTYRCRAGDNTFAEAKLTVEAPPSFVEPVRVVSRAVGEQVTLVCKPMGIPPPILRWFTEPLDPRRGLIFTGITGSKFHVLRQESTGEKHYKCMASNKHGNDTMTFTVQTSAQTQNRTTTEKDITEIWFPTSSESTTNTTVTGAKKTTHPPTAKLAQHSSRDASASSSQRSQSMNIWTLTFIALVVFPAFILFPAVHIR